MQNAKCKAKMRLRRIKLHGICAFLQRKVAQNSSSVLCRKVLCCLATFRQRWNCNKIMFESIAQNAKCKTQSVGRKNAPYYNCVADPTFRISNFAFRISPLTSGNWHLATGDWKLKIKAPNQNGQVLCTLSLKLN